VRIRHGLAERLATASQQLVLDRFGDEATSIPLQPVNRLDELRPQCDRDMFGRRHTYSMQYNMIILNTHDNVPSHALSLRESSLGWTPTSKRSTPGAIDT
jgi:hypothetical protein